MRFTFWLCIDVFLMMGTVLHVSCSESPGDNSVKRVVGDYDMNMLHDSGRTTINELTNEIKVMEEGFVNAQNKLDLYTGGDLGVMEDEARKRGALKYVEEAFIIK